MNKKSFFIVAVAAIVLVLGAAYWWNSVNKPQEAGAKTAQGEGEQGGTAEEQSQGGDGGGIFQEYAPDDISEPALDSRLKKLQIGEAGTEKIYRLEELNYKEKLALAFVQEAVNVGSGETKDDYFKRIVPYTSLQDKKIENVYNLEKVLPFKPGRQIKAVKLGERLQKKASFLVPVDVEFADGTKKRVFTMVDDQEEPFYIAGFTLTPYI